MNRKPRKVAEPAASYTVKKPVRVESVAAQSGIRYADLKKVRAANAKLIQVHHVVLEKLAR